MLFSSGKTFDLTSWSFIQLNPYSSNFTKGDIVLNLKLVDSKDVGICNIVDIYKDDKFLTSRDSLEQALTFVNTL